MKTRSGSSGTSAKLIAVWRYGLPTIGPVSGAAVQFVMSLELLHSLGPADFGSFSFLLIASQFALGLWSALFCAPLPVMVAGQISASQRVEIVRCMFSTCLVFSCLAALVASGAAVLIRETSATAGAFACFVFLSLCRWYARAYAYTIGNGRRTIFSDMLYALILAGCILATTMWNANSSEAAFYSLAFAAGIGLIPFGVSALKQQFLDVSVRYLADYQTVWRAHSRWSLLGVITTEATANAHAYLITALAGPLAFAPVAASSIIIRPISVVINALTDFERPRLGRLLSARVEGSVRRAMMAFRLSLASTWMGTAMLAVGLAVYAPHLIFPAQYRQEDITLGTVLWMVVAILRLARSPESTLLQAAGRFRPLAYASVISCFFSAAFVLVGYFLGGPMWSVLGVIIGEGVYLGWIWREAYRWAKSEKSLRSAEA